MTTDAPKPPTLAERIVQWANDRRIYKASASFDMLKALAAEVAALETGYAVAEAERVDSQAILRALAVQLGVEHFGELADAVTRLRERVAELETHNDLDPDE